MALISNLGHVQQVYGSVRLFPNHCVISLKTYPDSSDL